MPDGACVIRYRGVRGDVWRVKFRDADGRQVKETLGRASEGWTKRKAEAALRARLTDVARESYRKPQAVSFEAFAREWLDTYSDSREHRRTTRADYRAMVEHHLIPWFGSTRLADVTTADIDAYVAAKRRGKPPLGARTLGESASTGRSRRSCGSIAAAPTSPETTSACSVTQRRGPRSRVGTSARS